jgi:diacylglycerol kinase (ATP)
VDDHDADMVRVAREGDARHNSVERGSLLTTRTGSGGRTCLRGACLPLWIAGSRAEKAVMDRLVKAFFNSLRAFKVLSRNEKAFQQELALLAVAVPVGWFLASSWSAYALLVGSVLVLIMVEVLNTGIEAACDAISREFHIDIQLAKDCGSLAVLISVILVIGVWAIALIERVTGAPI